MTAFLQNIAKTYYEKHGTEISDYCFVFPNRRSGLFFQKYIAEIIDKPIFSPKTLTINELFMSQTEFLIADKLGLLFRIYNIYKKLAKSDETFDSFAYWGEMLLNDFDDVDKYLINAKQLFTNIKEIKEIDSIFDYLSDEQIAAIRSFWTNFTSTGEGKKQQDFISTWEILCPIYEQLRQELRENNLAYEGMIFREIVEKIEYSEDLFTSFDKIIFVGFNALTPCENRLFKYLKKRGKADFYWDYFSEKTQEVNNLASLFYRENTLAFPSKYELKEVAETDKKITLVGVPSSVGQTKEAYQILKKLNLNDETSFQTAIVLPEEKFLLPLLYSLPQEIENVNVTMGYPLSFTPLAGLIDYIIQLQKNVRKSGNEYLFYHKDVLSILNHQYILGSNLPEVKKLVAEINLKNRFYISEEQLGKTNLLQTIFKVEQQPQEIAGYLLRVLKQMQHLFSNKDDKRQNALEREFLYHYFTTVQRVEGLMKEWKTEMSADTFFRLLNKLISGINIPFTGEPLKGLQIMGVLETRALDFDNLIVTSMNEGIFPKKQAAPSFIPYNLRKGFGMPTTEHQDSIFAYHFYRLIHRAKNIFFLYDTRTEGLQTGEVSRFIHQLKYHYRLPVAEKLITYDVSIGKQDKITVEKSEKVMQKMAVFLSDESNKRALSASSINTYLDCQLKFYFSTIERLSESDEVKESIEAKDFGTIFHAVMEGIYKDNQLVTKELLAEIIKNDTFLEQVIKKAFAEKYLHRPVEKVEFEGQYYITASILKKYAKQLLKIDKQYAPFYYVKSEHYCTAKLPVFDGKKQVNLHGYIDRIDDKDGYTRIIDYKTGAGKANNKDKKVFSDIAGLFDKEDNNRAKEVLQLFTYSLMYQQETKKQNISPAIIFLRNLFVENANFGIIHKASNTVVDDFNLFSSDFEYHLTNCLEEIFNADIAFVQTENFKTCEYCAFREICKR